MIRYSQNDPRWQDCKIGHSKTTIGRQGCLITALCMLHSKFHPFTKYYPDQASKDWKFNQNLLRWDTKFKGMEFVERVWNYLPEHDQEIKKYSDSDDYGVALQVQTKGGVHWLAVWKWGWLGKPVCYDPWDGHILYSPYGWLGRYIRPLGWCLMKKKPL